MGERVSEAFLEELSQCALKIAYQQRGENRLQDVHTLHRKLTQEWRELDEAEEQWDEWPDVMYYTSQLLIQASLGSDHMLQALLIEIAKRGITLSQLERGTLAKYRLRASGQPKDIEKERSAILSAIKENKTMENFEQFIEAVKTQMQPEPRAKATAATLEQLVRLVPDGTTLADLALGWGFIADCSPSNDDPSVIARRKTCGELYRVASPIMFRVGMPCRTVGAWQAWVDEFDHASSDPRHASMGKTFARELAVMRKEVSF